MKSKITSTDIAAFIIWLLPAVYLGSIFSSLPETVPMHYNIHNEVDRYGNKSEFFWMEMLMMGVNLFVYLLLRFLSSIDPKRKVKYSETTFRKIALGVVVFMSAINIAIIYKTAHAGVPVTKILFPLLGLFFAFLGNMMYNIRPNYFAGVRTPWTLESEDNWKATHRLESKIWVPGGLLMCLATLVLPAKAELIIFHVIGAFLSIVPIIYSFIYFKKHQKLQ
jgi:uncharacterized membrane protein